MKQVIELTILFNALLYTALFLILLILIITFAVWFEKKTKGAYDFIFYVFVGPAILIFVLALLLVDSGSIPIILGG